MLNLFINFLAGLIKHQIAFEKVSLKIINPISVPKIIYPLICPFENTTQNENNINEVIIQNKISDRNINTLFLLNKALSILNKSYTISTAAPIIIEYKKQVY